MQQSHSWWFQSHNSPAQSPWLVSTLAELDAKIKAMLQLLEGDGDSFSKRVEMYYKKRPELVNMVEDLYRSQRSLAERYDQLRTRPMATLPSRRCSWNVSGQSEVVCHDHHSDESEVDDPHEEDEEGGGKDSITLMKEEIERLREENEKLRDEIRVKDEERRESARKLSATVRVMEEENASMRKWINRCKFFSFFRLEKLMEGIFFMRSLGGHF